MKNRFNKWVADSIEDHYFNIQQKDNNLIFELKNVFLPFSKKFLFLKHRKTGKRISKELINSKTILTLENIREIEEIGYFDIYLHVKIFGRFFRKRTQFNFKNNDDNYILDDENKLTFVSYSTSGSNLSFNFSESLCKVELLSINDEKDHISLNGKITLYEDINFSKVELLAKSNKTGRKSSLCSFSKDGKIINFSCLLEKEILEIDVNSKWNIFIRLLNDEFLFASENLNCDNFIKYKIKEEVLLEKIETIFDNEKMFIIFVSSKNRKLEFKIVSEMNYLNSNKRINENKLYNKFKKEGLNNKFIFFESFHGKYNNNPKYLYEKMLELGFNDNYQFIWAYDGEKIIPGNPIIVKSNSDEYFKYLSQSKYRINNTTFPIIDSNKKIVYVQTWHGTPLKRLSRDIKVKNGVGWSHFNKEVNTWNYLISANNYSTTIFKRAFDYKNKILEVGYPANDLFYLDETKQQEIKNKFDIPENKKIILYAPTFRDDKKDHNGNRIFDLELDMEKLYDKLRDEYFFIIKTHYVISEKLNIDEKFKDFAVDLSYHDDIHELFILSDILITDYSSSFFDFAHSKKPILFFMPDLKTYMETRGLYQEILMELPGPILINSDEIVDALIDLDNVTHKFEEKYSKFYDKFCKEGKGDASLNIIQSVWGENYE